MLAFSLLVLILSAASPAPGVEPARAPPPSPSGAQADVVPATYDGARREVTNWRKEAFRALSPAPLAMAAVLFQVERPVISRCVKLNNYWCIKRARWTGEVGADEEGHTGFASAAHGADAAATLLRRYYTEFGRRSALDIVRRWAPAECRIGGGWSGLPATILAVRGLANTLRARFLASRGRGGVARVTAGRGTKATSVRRAAASRIALAPMPSYRVPDIAAGLGERKPAPRSAQPAARSRRIPQVRSVVATRAAGPKPAAVQSAPRAPVQVASAAPSGGGCGSSEQRIQNYAARIAGAAGVGPSDDLRLFDGEGRIMPNLQPVLLAMSSVELGLLKASVDLVEAALLRTGLMATATKPAGAAAAEAAPPVP